MRGPFESKGICLRRVDLGQHTLRFCFGLVTFGLLLVGPEGVRQGGGAPGIEIGEGRYRLKGEVRPDASGLLEEHRLEGEESPDMPDDEVLQAVVAKSDRLVRYWEPANEILRSQTHMAMYTAVDQRTGEDVVVTLYYMVEQGKKKYLTLSKNTQNLESVITAEEDEQAYLLSEERQCHLVRNLLEKAKSTNHPAAKRILNCFETHVADGSVPAFVVMEPGPKRMSTDLRFYKRAKHRDAHERVARVKTAHEAAMQMLSLVDLMSGEGIVHHDFQPRNLLFKLNEPNSPEVQIKLVGWNYATDAEQRGQYIKGCQNFQGLFRLGSYIPPEGCQSDASSAYDIFSVGVLFAEWLAPYMLRTDPQWAKLVKAGYKTLSPKDIDELQVRSLRDNFVFPDSDARLLKQMMSSTYSERPTAKAAAAMLYPKWLQKLDGSWQASGSPRKYTITNAGAAPPTNSDVFYEFYPAFHVEVWKADSLKGEGFFAEFDCLPEGEGAPEDKGDAKCCRVPVTYNGKVGVFPRTCDVVLRLCGTSSIDQLEALETTSCIWKPDGLVKTSTIFTRSR